MDDDSYNIREIEVDPSWIEDLNEAYFTYRQKWDIANQGHLFSFPLFLEVETSYACNYRCAKCPRQVIGHTKKIGFLQDDLIDKLFDEAQRHGLASITLSHGGEPLIRKDIPQLIRRAQDAGILDRMFHTNGSLLSKELSRELIESGLTKINFSLDAASPGVYKTVRSGGNYEKVIHNIEQFLQMKNKFGKSYPRVRVSFVVSEENKHEQKRFYDLWKNKVNVISFQKCYNFKELDSNIGRGAVHGSAKAGRKFFCTQLWQLLTITHEGDVLICERDYGHRYVLGNLRNHTIFECWHSDLINHFRKLHIQNQWHEIPICRQCVNCVDRDIGIEV